MSEPIKTEREPIYIEEIYSSFEHFCECPICFINNDALAEVYCEHFYEVIADTDGASMYLWKFGVFEKGDKND